KIIRSKQSSTQLSTYFVGRTAFHQLRQAVQRERGDRFELGRYHEAVLAHGTLYGLQNTLLHPDAPPASVEDNRPRFGLKQPR
ncbi:MAG: DUF885 family protein, partial [Singulisphaera sp.]